MKYRLLILKWFLITRAGLHTESWIIHSINTVPRVIDKWMIVSFQSWGYSPINTICVSGYITIFIYSKKLLLLLISCDRSFAVEPGVSWNTRSSSFSPQKCWNDRSPPRPHHSWDGICSWGGVFCIPSCLAAAGLPCTFSLVGSYFLLECCVVLPQTAPKLLRAAVEHQLFTQAIWVTNIKGFV